MTDKFPYICQHLRMMRKGQKKDICPLGYWNPTVDHPELMVNATEEPRKTVADLIRTEMFHYAKSNMALVNIYIKVSKIKTFLLDLSVSCHEITVVVQCIFSRFPFMLENISWGNVD